MKAGSVFVRARAVVAVLLGTGLGLSALAALAGPAAAADTDAVIRGAHFSPTTPGVDVYLTSFAGGSSNLWLKSVTYAGVSPYERVAPGLYTVAMRAAGADPATPPVLSWTLDAKAGGAYTVAGVGAGASVRGIVINDDLSTPPAGEGRVRLVQAASRAPSATVTTSQGTVIAQNAAFATTTPYTSVPAGTWTLSAVANGANAETSSSISVTPGVSTSVLLLDGQTAGITIRTVLDSSSSGPTPVGAVPAGGGGMAGAVAGPPAGAGAGTSVGLMGAVAAVLIAAGAAAPPAARGGRRFLAIRYPQLARSGGRHVRR